MGLWLAIGVAVLALFTAFADRDSGVATWWELRGDLREVRARIAALEDGVDALERDVGGLEADPFALERAIRERLQYARPGETLIRTAPRDPANARIP